MKLDVLDSIRKTTSLYASTTSHSIYFRSAIEQFMRFCPDLLNLPKDDGYTALHLSALNDHLDVLTALVEHVSFQFCADCSVHTILYLFPPWFQESVEVDCRTHEQQTPLHLAAHKGNGTIVERLVGFGACLNVQDKDGDTPLHIVLMVRQAEALTEETPQLMKVCNAVQYGMLCMLVCRCKANSILMGMKQFTTQLPSLAS